MNAYKVRKERFWDVMNVLKQKTEKGNSIHGKVFDLYDEFYHFTCDKKIVNYDNPSVTRMADLMGVSSKDNIFINHVVPVDNSFVIMDLGDDLKNGRYFTYTVEGVKEKDDLKWEDLSNEEKEVIARKMTFNANEVKKLMESRLPNAVPYEGPPEDPFKKTDEKIKPKKTTSYYEDVIYLEDDVVNGVTIVHKGIPKKKVKNEQIKAAIDYYAEHDKLMAERNKSIERTPASGELDNIEEFKRTLSGEVS